MNPRRAQSETTSSMRTVPLDSVMGGAQLRSASLRRWRRGTSEGIDGSGDGVPRSRMIAKSDRRSSRDGAGLRCDQRLENALTAQLEADVEAEEAREQRPRLGGRLAAERESVEAVERQ